MALHIPTPHTYMHQNKKSSLSLHTPCSNNAPKYLLLLSARNNNMYQFQSQLVHDVKASKNNMSYCRARRRVRYNEEEGEEEEYGNNMEIAMLETYSENERKEALLVKATVDGQEELVLIFKGFSSCLTATTVTDPSKSVLPARAVIESIDVIKGPFDPTNIEYLEKGLTWDAFKTRLQ